MKNNSDHLAKSSGYPKFAKTAREWILASALYDGIEDGDIRQIEMLISERGANPNVLLAEYGISPFHLVVANENTGFAVKATDLCLQHGADPNVRSEDGLTPVHLAAMWGCTEVLHLLLASGGDPWLVDDVGLNAFDYALRENQLQCYQTLNTYCNSQPKQSGCKKSPYQLNLKRVILYKNDLQIVYEASPSNSAKSISTQTSPNATNKIGVEALRCSTSHEISAHNCNQKSQLSNFTKNDDNNFNLKNIETPITSRLKEIIENHRRNSILFEYSPVKEEKNCAKNTNSSDVESWKDTDQSELIMTGFSELINKLDETKKLRQSLKSSDISSDWLKNITVRKLPCVTPKPFTAPSNRVSVINGNLSFDKSNEYEVPKNEIGFVLNGSKVNSTNLEDQDPNLNESPPSIGFILDHLSDLCAGQDSSLFSDIASDIEVFSTPVRNENVENIMTEDEKSPEVKIAENSSSDSLHPYVSCENTRERESIEEFASCRNSESFMEGLKKKQEPPAIVDALNDYFVKQSRTARNPEVITSTPEKSENSEETQTENCEDVKFDLTTNINLTIKNLKRLSAGSDETNSSSSGGAKPNQNQENLEPSNKKLSWVEAKVTSSSEDEPYMSISEEYEYTDMDEGVVLIEKRYLTKDISMSGSGSENIVKRESSSSECESVSTLSGSEGAYDTDELRRALVQHGFVPGPITGNTKRVYLRKLKRCRRKPLPLPQQDGQTPAFSSELLKTIAKPCDHLLADWAHLEDSMSASFSCARRPWREGQARTSFTYLLLDPRIAHNLPARAASDPTSTQALWGEFLRSVFYVGKGKRSRPYSHLYQAVAAWQQNKCSGLSKKMQRILDIWKSGNGVICLHVFLNVIPVEAFTREAAMICAMTLSHLTNEQVGKFYGSAATWTERLRRRLGSVLLHRAFKVFLAEGERQLRPADID